MNKKLIIGSGIILLVVIYLFWSGIKDSSSYFLELDQFFQQQKELVGKGVRINGQLIKESINWDAENLILTFQMTDGKDTLNVRHKGVAPDTFEEAPSVVVEGKYENGIFNATQIMTKCPSKYEAKRE